MTSHRHLRRCAVRLILRDAEKQDVERSVRTVIRRLRRYFQKEIKQIEIFGSFSRGTLLPRIIDERSDVDLMVIFSEKDATPQTYLNRLRRFAESNYSTSEIHQSSPTIVLSLNHINIEIVPAVKTWVSGLSIPAPSSNFIEWMEVDPTEFNAKLQVKNRRTGSQMKPLIRLAKYWNATQGYVYPSFELEQRLVSHWYFREKNIQDYFVAGLLSLELSWQSAKWKKEKLDRTKEIIESVIEAERSGRPEETLSGIKKLLPEFW